MLIRPITIMQGGPPGGLRVLGTCHELVQCYHENPPGYYGLRETYVKCITCGSTIGKDKKLPRKHDHSCHPQWLPLSWFSIDQQDEISDILNI